MARFSKPHLETQADELNAKILSALAEVGIQATMNENVDGIMIPEYHFVIASVSERYSGSGFSRRLSGTLEVDFRSIHMGRGCLCHAKRLQIDSKDLIKKVVASTKERRDAILAQKAREKAEEKAHRAHETVLKDLRKDFSAFKSNIETHRSQINLNFHNLSEDQARLILGTLNAAGITGSK
jgi:hypothetical protein